MISTQTSSVELCLGCNLCETFACLYHSRTTMSPGLCTFEAISQTLGAVCTFLLETFLSVVECDLRRVCTLWNLVACCTGDACFHDFPKQLGSLGGVLKISFRLLSTCCFVNYCELLPLVTKRENVLCFSKRFISTSFAIFSNNLSKFLIN